jgi:hypothetical protein
MDKYYIMGAIGLLALSWQIFKWFAESSIRRLTKKDLEYKNQQWQRKEMERLSSLNKMKPQNQIIQEIKISELEAQIINERFYKFLDENNIDRRYANNPIFLLQLEKARLARSANDLLYYISSLLGVLSICFMYMDSVYFPQGIFSYYTILIFLMIGLLMFIIFRDHKNVLKTHRAIWKFRNTRTQNDD